MSLRGLFVAALAFAGCMPTVPTPSPLSPSLRPGRGDTGLTVLLPHAGDPLCRRELLGVVEVRSPRHDEAALLDALRRRADALGGDRVVDIELQREAGGDTYLSGMVARCSELLVARGYEVVQRFSVSADGRDHRAALDAMVERARALQAHLVVDIDYEQAALDDGRVYLRGTAARYVAHWEPSEALLDGPSGTGPAAGPRRTPASGPRLVCPPPSVDPSGNPVVPWPSNCYLRF